MEIKKTILFILCSLSLFACTPSTDNSIKTQIIGEWRTDDSCSKYFQDGFRINEDGTIEGVQYFQTYEIEEGNKDYDYMILDGAEDLTRFKIRMEGKDEMEVVEDDDSDAFESGLSCNMEKVE